MAAGHCAEGGRDKSERAGTAGRTAVEYEYRCAEYEYEYDGGGNPLRCLAVIRTQSASADGTRTRTRTRFSSDTPMMLSAKITIGGPRFPPGSPRWKQQLTAT